MVAGCIALVTPGESPQGVDEGLVLALGGPASQRVLDEGATGRSWYWLRVWGARGLLWAWDDSATQAVAMALQDPQWRVREMACRVVARHGVGDLLTEVAELRHDPSARVRTAAEGAVVVVTAAGA